MAKKTSERVSIDDIGPEILAAETFARAALSMMQEMRWPPARTREEYMARSRLSVLVGATAEAAEKLVAMIEMPAPDRRPMHLSRRTGSV